MNATTTACELHFASLLPEGCTLSFPCDAAGHVDLDALGERSLLGYLYARTTIGHDFARPCVQPQALH